MDSQSDNVVMRRVFRWDWIAVVLTLTCILATWIGFFFFGPLTWLFPFACLLLLVRRRFRILAIGIVISPLTLGFILGLINYTFGTARLMHVGLPGTTFFNIDPEVRVGRSTSGCIVQGGEWMLHWSNNLAVRGISFIFGPMPGAYVGPYPTKEEAKNALEYAFVQDPAAFYNSEVVVDSNKYYLDEGVGKGLLSVISVDDWPMKDKPDDPLSIAPIKAVIWQHECIIVQIPTNLRLTKSAVIVLFDMKTGRPFAYYPEGNYYHRSPPVPWKANK